MAKDVGAYLKKQQEQSPPELSQQWAEFEELYNKRLWHQLTLKLLTFVRCPQMQQGSALFQMYENFISEFENKMKPLSLVEIAAQVSQSIPDMEQRLGFITKTKEKKVLEETESQAESLPGVTEVHGRFYQLCSDYHQQMGDHQAYYRDALRFLGCTSLDRIPMEEQRQRAFALCLAALLGEGVYNFGELLAHPILECLQGTDRHWVVQLLSAFNSGSLAQYEALRPAWSLQPDLAACELSLRQKMCLLCLMEMAFQRPGSRLSFQEIAAQARLPLNEVEVLVMKALSLGLVRGTIDQVDGQVHMQWVQPRVLSREQIAGMKKRLDAWNADVASMEKLLETKAHEIISI
ncbi:26S proteasome non-ATPase regulatory subunit 13 isoform X2 [Dermacentor silvarum]|uniref:26S proteasome non-ATPase regulatory subunit 13 isoform X2 n=1 Tax=Dermacentor silvarum TaxID=543639 RepID=UPI00210189D9|nr:26S proteasome non-ATPase regulatory subunit 13 isoform X2 [Dermacentor silvarum]